MSSYLYYGPGSFKAALSRQSLGRRLGGPFGEGGLKIEEARSILSLLEEIPPGRQVCTIIVGPLDKATPSAADVLLKTIEEPPKKVEIILWAEDLGGVPPTIVSRCWPVWCLGEEAREKIEEAKVLSEYLEQGHLAEAISVLRENKDSLEELMRSLAWIASENSSENLLQIWGRVRILMGRPKIGFYELCSSLLKG